MAPTNAIAGPEVHDRGIMQLAPELTIDGPQQDGYSNRPQPGRTPRSEHSTTSARTSSTPPAKRSRQANSTTSSPSASSRAGPAPRRT